jgi:hypothetical protein
MTTNADLGEKNLSTLSLVEMMESKGLVNEANDDAKPLLPGGGDAGRTKRARFWVVALALLIVQVRSTFSSFSFPPSHPLLQTIPHISCPSH